MRPDRAPAFDTRVYLRRLGYTGPLDATLETLRELHRRHLRTIPYDNTRFPEGGGPLPANLADVDIDAAFDKIVVRGSGGICFELNLLMRRLLDDAGFTTRTFSAGVRQDNGTFSPDLSHRLTGVDLDGEVWLADVGFSGPLFIEPLRVAPGVEQHQHGCGFKVTVQGSRNVVHRRCGDGEWRAVYRFRPRHREVAEWDGFTARLQRFLAEAGIVNTTMVCRATESGHDLVVGRRHLRVDGGREYVGVLTDPAAHQAALDRIRCGADASAGRAGRAETHRG
ncbi:arylamine N-acetyltransferase [Nocardiopsis mangrovi]|uniref:Arylamine N-acetyltransferase n=1 Tax=Nocardiopsis mangrovi TaxID=1179818 RepID=A0ABV9E2H6_9ACTN